MKFCKRHAAKLVVSGSTCSAWEYALHDKDIDAAVIEITGPYPHNGWALNESCKLIAYVIKGKGTLKIKDQPPLQVEEGDMVLIDIGEHYHWEGTLTLLMPAAPAWTPEQYKIIQN